ncbi:MAG: DUF5057 domain-containing protein [Eubacteriales bacterium]
MNNFQLKNRMIAVLLCFVMVVAVISVFFFSDTQEVAASQSLSGIETLKNTKSEYQILEIVPDMSQGAFAWYVGGSEAVNSRKLSSAYSSETNMYVNKYQEITDMLQTQNYLLGKGESNDPSLSILGYLGKVSANGSVVSGGFENNEWFLRYVLDWNEGETAPEIKVNTVSPEYVTEAHISLADMVIISGGFYYPDATVSPMAYSESKDLSPAVVDAIISATKGDLSLILDRRAYVTGLETSRLFQVLLEGDPITTSSGVYGPVFYFSSLASGEERENAVTLNDGSVLGIVGNTNQGFLVTPQFNTPFDSSMTGEYGPFADVMDSIKSENTKRLMTGQTLISEELTMARVIQYLITGAGNQGSAEESKANVTVLSIQPGDASDIARYSESFHEKFTTDEPTVTAQVGLPSDPRVSILSDQISWSLLEAWTGVSRENITVIEMTAKEFSMESESVISLYDLVYIGNDISASTYGVYGESDIFNRGNQNYASEGSQSYFAVMGEDLQTPSYSYRALDNDISVTKYQEILAFAEAGRPVILAPYLCGGLNYRTINNVPSSMTVDSNSNLYRLMNKISGLSSVFRQDLLIVGEDGVLGNSDDGAFHQACQKAVHIPSPAIEFATLSSSMPSAYDESSFSVMTLSTGSSSTSLEYIFKISGLDEDASPFSVEVSLDLDGSGAFALLCNYDSSFKISRLQTDGNGDLVLDSRSQPIREIDVAYNQLVQNQYYRVSVDLATEIQGIVPWKISITSQSNPSVSSEYKALTYVIPKTLEEVAILQVYDSLEVNMEESDLYQQLLGISAGEHFSEQMSEDVSVTVNSVSVNEFNEMVANGFSVSDVYDKYDLLVLGSGAVSGKMTAGSHSFVSSYLSWSGNLLVIDSGLDKDNFPFYGGIYSASGNLSSSTNTNLNQLNSEKFKNYPFTISLADAQYVYQENNYYYSNVTINDTLSNAQIFVNTLATIVPFSAYDSGDSGSTATSNITFWESDAGITGAQLSTNLNYIAGGITDIGTLTEDPRTIYFSLPHHEATGAIYFNLADSTGSQGIVSGISSIFDDLGNEYAYTSRVVDSYALFHFTIPYGLTAGRYQVQITAKEEANSVAVAVGVLNITVTNNTDVDALHSVNLLQQGTFIRDEDNVIIGSVADSENGKDFIYLIPQG